MTAYLLALTVVTPWLCAAWLLGRRYGRRHELPVWVVVVLTLMALPTRHWSFMAPGVAFMLGWSWGHRPRGQEHRAHRRDVARLALALDRGELRFHYQPIVDQLSDIGPVVVCAEALVRWLPPDGKMVFPGPWLDTIQADPDLSCRFSDLLWGDVSQVAAMFPHIRISVNTMPNKVAEVGWAENLVALLPAGVLPQQFTIEVIEGALLQDTPTVHHNLELLRSAGFHVALDDFGEGQANMVTFMTFQHLVDTVKIDQKLIRHPDHRGAESLIELARSFGKHVVAEGVETQECADWLRGLGVSQIQGWLFSKALPVETFTPYVLAHAASLKGGATLSR